MDMKRLFLIVCLFWLMPHLSPAQEPPVATAQRPISDRQWEQASGGLDYSTDLPEKPKPKKQNSTGNTPSTPRSPMNWGTGFSEFWAGIFQVFSILVALGVVGYGIYRMMQEPRSKRIARDGAEITVENLEAYLDETDLSHFLRDALAKRQYALAVRLYFLQSIKDLSVAGAIQWSKEKTNRDYLREMRNHTLYEDFRQLTGSFERIWYGNAGLTGAEFAVLEPRFQQFLKSVR